MAADASSRPKPVHGSASGAIPFRFWSQPGDDLYDKDNRDDHSSSEDDIPSTSEFARAAVEAGFTVDQFSRAERALDAGTVSSPGGVNLARSIVDKLVQRKTSGRRWQGPLPPPRVSLPRTLGDAIAMASY